MQDWVVERQLQDGSRRRRRGEPRRLHQAVRGAAEPDAAARRTTSRCSSVFTALAARQRQRRRQLHRTGRAAVPDPRHRPAALAGDDIGNIVVAEHGGTPIWSRDIGDRDDRRRAAPGPGRRRTIEDDIVTGIVLMRKGENPSEVLTAREGQRYAS